MVGKWGLGETMGGNILSLSLWTRWFIQPRGGFQFGYNSELNSVPQSTSVGSNKRSSKI